jgi:tRNA1Val (adenine37-N6)-methyltransferase
MKVGTDGSLLGAWAPAEAPKKILDVGTGTGLIALMLAQRFPKAHITAIEPNKEAALDAYDNFACSKFSDSLELIKISLQDFPSETRFDLITCNPPFFSHSLPAPEPGRHMARHADTLSHSDLIAATKLLAPGGLLAGIYPADLWPKVKKDALGLGLIFAAEQPVKPLPEKPPHRVLFALAQEEGHWDIETTRDFTIETGKRHCYSEEFKLLLKPFYLKL